ncbi:class I SAM-dependent DNA methyltransferase [Pinisolibacter aquiterrae]|uniref:class I SAM-dependent DNA methyltransferase n=1 Tax=Pinisolibacter aquiterrae TaxID=2815579 RepID=UPI001C3D670D|nr:methyltransferase domain-containing protein [Pinisolibacter aquiterrae]MBV5266780.1 methyltransferase domain-containing protein [Pinisolibacter aquiterrae]MCC8234907.1 methyltransferase domain-containing protein [Pinisolibacter aquiterrae]
MTPASDPASSRLTSGDPIADRRFQRARDYAAGGDPAAAAELMEQALEIAPDWAAGWFALGEFRLAAALETEAVAAFERAIALDPSDRCGATLRLARLGARPVPDVPPAAHVRDLFDGYAARFEDSLINRLGYRAPATLAEAITAFTGARRFASGLDLGCGTGLMARALARRVDRLDGVDLSAAMIDVARASRLYHGLEVGDLLAALDRRADGTLDLVTAADVFCYLGDLGAIFAAVARVTTAEGLFAFTVEKAGDDEGIRLGEGLRYAHGRRHLETAGRAAGWSRISLEETVLRRDRGQDVVGFVAVFTKS